MDQQGVQSLRGGAGKETGARHYDVIVIGGGQAGLSVGRHLATRGLRFVILDAEVRIGDVWRKRWDSLRLFTPAWLDGLDGMPFPGPRHAFPTKDEMADYLESYAARFSLPVESGTKVDRLTTDEHGYLVTAGARTYHADQVVVATGAYQRPRIPAFASSLGPDVVQLHASAYKSPAQLRDGDVLLVGAGNSGAEIGLELSRQRRVYLSGPSTGEVPFRVNGLAARIGCLRLLLRFVFHRLLTVNTPLGRKARPKLMGHGQPLIRTRLSELCALGVERVARVTGAASGQVMLEDGRALPVANVVWCTGYQPGFSWIDLDLFDADGKPRHDGGVVRDQPGLYFVGLPFLYAVSSSMIHGVGRDAARIAAIVAARHAVLAPRPSQTKSSVAQAS